MQTTKDKLIGAFDDLVANDLKKFKGKLCDRQEEPRIRRGAVEKAIDSTDLADLIVNTFTERKAVEITVEILKSIGLNQVAEDLRKESQK